MSIDQLWHSVASSNERFDPSASVDLPALARRYLARAIPADAPLYRAARLTMSGEMMLGERWRPFRAEQVIHGERGFLWQARTRVGWLPVRGIDRFIDGLGVGKWRLLGVIPLASDGPNEDMNRSAAARYRIESLWLPSMLVRTARFEQTALTELTVGLDAHGYGGEHVLALDDDGMIRRAQMQRWGRPPGAVDFVAAPFGCVVDADAEFCGYRVASKLRVGWYPQGDGFAPGGEFWRATIEDIAYR